MAPGPPHRRRSVHGPRRRWSVRGAPDATGTRSAPTIWNADSSTSQSRKRSVPGGYRSPPDSTARVAARSAATSARFARFSRRSARRASLSLPGCRSARCFARSAFATRRDARLSARAYLLLARSAWRVRRQATNLAVSGQTSQTTAAVPARSSAPRLPASTPYQAPATTAGNVATCRSQEPYLTARACRVIRVLRRGPRGAAPNAAGGRYCPGTRGRCARRGRT